jgi:dolichyl-phosphate-mannose-protein mannosyltransferase
VQATNEGARARRFVFPVSAFLVWRIAHLLIVQGFGGQSALRQVSGLQPASHPGFFLWDGAWYQLILRSGYRPIPGAAQQPANFFPLLPWATRAVRVVVRSELAAAIVVTSVAALAAVVLVFEVMRRWKGESVARWTVVLLLAFPTSFFLWEFYTEALLIAFSAGAIVAMHEDKVWLAGVLGGVAAMARPPGILVMVVLGVMYLEKRRAIHWDIAWLGLCAVGLGIVMVVMKQQAGNALAFSTGAQGWGRHFSLPWVPVNQSLRQYIRGSGPALQGWSWSTLATVGSPRDVAATYVFLFLFVVSMFRSWPWAARALIFTMTVAPITTGLVQSMDRYVLAAWPAFGVAAEVPRAWRPWLLGGVTAVLIALSVAVLHDWSRGLFIA